MAVNAGDIAIIGFNADGTDNLAFVVLVDIAAGEQIRFEDNEWNGTAFGDTNESGFVWTVTTAIAAGTVVRFDSLNSESPAASTGTIAYDSARGTNRGISNENETVYVYQTGDSGPRFITAVGNDGFTAANGVLTGTGLVEGDTALNLGALDADLDIAAFTGARNGQTSFAAYRALINTPADGDWVFQDGSGDQGVDGTAPDVPFDPTAFQLGSAPPPQTVTLSPATLSRAEGDTGATAFSFTVARTGGTTGQVNFSGTVASSQADAADFAGTPLTTGFSGSIPAGAASATFTVQVAGDTAVEAAETFTVTLTTAGNTAGSTVSIGAADDATATILNDDAGDSIGGVRVYDAADLASLAGSTTAPAATNAIELVRLGSFNGTGSVAAGRSEVVAFDPGTDNLYINNGAQVSGTPGVEGRIDIARVGADGSLTANGSINLSGFEAFGGVNSVAVKNGLIAVAYQNVAADQPGRVVFFSTAEGNPQVGSPVVVGVLPDAITFSPDGSKVLVSNEAQALSTGNDPVGSVSIIDVVNGVPAATARSIGFSALNGSEPVLQERGLQIFPGQSAAQDFEPEYISVSPDGTRAYVTLQEVNAVAVIDLTDPNATAPIAIQPLGFVDRNLDGNEFDPSDRDGPPATSGGNGTPSINLRNFDVLSLLQPDAIASFTAGGATYFITANEGDAREAIDDEATFNEASYVLDPTAYPNAAELKADANLGRLRVLTTIGDTDGDGDFDQVYTYGGRGFTIFRQEADGSLTKVRESGSEFEAILAAQFPTLFNIENASAIDNRSDNKGPEPEGVAVGVIDGRTYAFINLERVGGVMIYDVTDPENASYVGFRPATSQDFGPEATIFISAADSPTGEALVVTANEVSGTTTLYSAQLPRVTVGFAPGQGNVQLTEGGTFTFTVTRSSAAGADTFSGEIAPSAATRADFLGLPPGPLAFSGSFAPGALTATVTLVSRGDRNAEPDEAFTLRLTEVSDGEGVVGAINPAAATAIGVIINDDTGPDGDTLAGTADDDKLFGQEGDDSLQGLGGLDLLSGDAGRDTLAGGADSDRLFGGDGADVLLGQAGRDTLNGGADNDTLTGGGDRDVLIGGDGDDVFRFANAIDSERIAADVIGDFAAGDRIDLSAIDADDDSGNGDSTFDFIGAGPFTGQAGELRVVVALNGNTFVLGDTDGDRDADLVIVIRDPATPVTEDAFAL